MNQQLGGAGYSEQLVTDLGLDMTDGITLLHLVQALGECTYIGGLFRVMLLISRVLFYGLSHFFFLDFNPLGVQYFALL